MGWKLRTEQIFTYGEQRAIKIMCERLLVSKDKSKPTEISNESV